MISKVEVTGSTLGGWELTMHERWISWCGFSDVVVWKITSVEYLWSIRSQNQRLGNHLGKAVTARNGWVLSFSPLLVRLVPISLTYCNCLEYLQSLLLFYSVRGESINICSSNQVLLNVIISKLQAFIIHINLFREFWWEPKFNCDPLRRLITLCDRKIWDR